MKLELKNIVVLLVFWVIGGRRRVVLHRFILMLWFFFLFSYLFCKTPGFLKSSSLFLQGMGVLISSAVASLNTTEKQRSNQDEWMDQSESYQYGKSARVLPLKLVIKLEEWLEKCEKEPEILGEIERETLSCLFGTCFEHGVFVRSYFKRRLSEEEKRRVRGLSDAKMIRYFKKEVEKAGEEFLKKFLPFLDLLRCLIVSNLMGLFSSVTFLLGNLESSSDLQKAKQVIEMRLEKKENPVSVLGSLSPQKESFSLHLVLLLLPILLDKYFSMETIVFCSDHYPLIRPENIIEAISLPQVPLLKFVFLFVWLFFFFELIILSLSSFFPFFSFLLSLSPDHNLSLLKQKEYLCCT